MQPHALSTSQLGEMLAALCGSYEVELDGGRLRLQSRPLRAGAVAAVLPDVGDGVLRLVYDTAKPGCFQQVQQMIRELWESCVEPVAFPDGSVELLRRVSPEPPVGPVRVAVLSEAALD